MPERGRSKAEAEEKRTRYARLIVPPFPSRIHALFVLLSSRKKPYQVGEGASPIGGRGTDTPLKFSLGAVGGGDRGRYTNPVPAREHG